MNKDNNNSNTPTTSMFTYLDRVQKYVKKYAENCRYSFNSMFQI
ncbi:hypothetical protein [Maribacter polysiphoniae]|uniref:Uncharacterized protein n=1 Tax=Maribacter polysiphoniae TaxID=429344 RepID=A0A316DVP9_9FLAO|nr:hypothetical protein [Maribacter polysiphoniae]PWK22184.1 hypothetical protein LX92_03101 [Maribacter polysiphoniae]